MDEELLALGIYPSSLDLTDKTTRSAYIRPSFDYVMVNSEQEKGFLCIVDALYQNVTIVTRNSNKEKMDIQRLKLNCNTQPPEQWLQVYEVNMEKREPCEVKLYK